MARRHRHGLLALSLGVATAKSAPANAPAPFSRPTGAVPGVVVERASPVRVEREELAIDCTGVGAPLHSTCTFRATYFLANPTDAEEELVGAFYTLRSGGVEARLDGVAVHADLTPEQVERLDAIVRDDPAIAELTTGDGALNLVREGFRIVVRPAARARLVFTGPLQPTRFIDDNPREGYAFPPLYTRHPFGTSSGSLAWSRGAEDYLYLVSPISKWAGDPEVVVTIRHDARTDFHLVSPRASATTMRDGNVETERLVFRASSRENLRFGLAYTPPFLKNGGPVLGIGPRIGREELRVKTGYDVGLSSFMVLGGSAETNFDRYITGAVVLDAATPSFVGVIPSLSAGAGVPVQFRHGEPTRVGARFQIGISWPLVGISLPIDVYPTGNSSGSHVEGAFMTQVSF
jgi:hypothetical protein